MELKEYQKITNAKLEKYLKLCAQYNDVKQAFYEITKESFGAPAEYNDAGLGNIPYVCLRLPTGGGKTILAAHSISIAANHFLEIELPLVLWLVPSRPILEQTFNALNNPRHPYRLALTDSFKDRVNIMKVEDALNISKADLEGNVNVIVTTYALWRIGDTESRKVYETNGSLHHHFSNLDAKTTSELESYEENGALKYSLANLIYLNNPLIIIDEAHNARTPLTFTTLKRLNPACIVEFTATPKNEGEDASNVIHYVSASELKNDNMIKLPIELYAIPEWHNTVYEAVSKQKELEEIAKKEEGSTGKYIRPIVLIQAEHDSKEKETINVEIVREYLISKCEITEDQIARATGEDREIENIDLLDKNCKIRFIITKQALKEGWDCPFAYIFCSVANVRSNKDVEQLLGRVLRMPYVEKKINQELNVAYAFAKSLDFNTVANNLKDSLVNSGFTKQEANTYLRPCEEQAWLLSETAGLPSQQFISTPDVNRLSIDLKRKIYVDSEKQTFTLVKRITFEEKEELKNIFSNDEDKNNLEKIFNEINLKPKTYKSPYEKGKRISLPQLFLNLYSESIIFDEEALLLDDWSIVDCDTQISEEELPVVVQIGERGEIDIDKRGKSLISRSSYIQEKLERIYLEAHQDKNELIKWLFQNVQHSAIPPAQMVKYLTKVIDTLEEKRKLKLEHLIFLKRQLRDVLINKIKYHIAEAKKKGYQTILGFKDNSIKDEQRFILGSEFEFRDEYPVLELYQGSYAFKKHYHKILSHMNGEEEGCASMIDSNPNVDVWLRNLDRNKDYAFWLQTSTDKFYPDFIAKLVDGTIVIVEYKNEKDYTNADSIEKNRIGEIYAAISGGKIRFKMLNGKDWKALSYVLENQLNYDTSKFKEREIK